MNSRRVKVLFLDHAPVMGGAEMSLLDILAGLKACASIEPVLLAPSQGMLYQEARELGIPVLGLQWSGAILSLKRQELERNPFRLISGLPRIISLVWRIRSILSQEGFDAIYTNTLKSHIIGGVAGRLAGVKVIWHFRDIPVQRLSRLVSRVGASLLPDRIIAVSRAVAAQFPPPRTTVIYNGFDFDRISRRAQEPLPVKMPGRPWLEEKRPIVGMVGQVSRWKGQDVFLKAASRLAGDHPEVRFLIVGGALFGEDAYRRELEEQARAQGLAERVAFAGHLDNPYPVMKRLAVLVHCPVEPEPFGRVLVESLALGVPVVASRIGADEEIIEDGVNGTLVPPDDPEALARGVEAMWAKRGTANSNISAARRFNLGPMLEAITTELLAQL
jgi:glycosyltransferase involved in cell wall biosynthesis